MADVLVSTVRQMTSFFSQGKTNWYTLVANQGSVYRGAPQDHGFPPGEKKECFSNALHLALEKHLLYAEGYATHQKLGGVPIEHAWCVSPDGEVVDTTWSYPDAVYIGLVFHPVKAARIVKKLGTYGIGSSLYRDRDGSAWRFIQKEFSK
jgi:hypothetical protein